MPVASAVDVADPSDPYEPVPDPADAGGSALDSYKVASQNEGHTLMTAELRLARRGIRQASLEGRQPTGS